LYRYVIDGIRLTEVIPPLVDTVNLPVCNENLNPRVPIDTAPKDNILEEESAV
jgi:hypothetical protein